MKKTVENKIIAIMILILMCGVVMSSPSHVNTDYYRLRIVANSNSEMDQKMKYEIRDKVIALTRGQLENTKTKRAAKEYITSNLKIIEEEAEKIIASYGVDYEIKLKQGSLFFPDKYYGKQYFKSGKYDALKIELGEAKGQNWWCVMFPPLCVIAFESDEVPDGEVEYKSFFVEKYLEMTEKNEGEYYDEEQKDIVD